MGLKGIFLFLLSTLVFIVCSFSQSTSGPVDYGGFCDQEERVRVKGGTVKLSGYLETYAPTEVPGDKPASQ